MTSLLVLSLPTKVAPAIEGSSLQAPEVRIKQWIEHNVGAKHGVASIALPDLKIGTLDALVQHSEEVARLDTQLQQFIGKVHESITGLWDSPDKIREAETVDGLPAWQYLQQFGWNTAKYRPDRSISKLLDMIGTEAVSADNDLRERLTAYGSAKAAVSQLDRKYAGDLSVRSLEAVVRPRDVVTDSEYLESVLVVVPNSQVKEFLNDYETLVPMTVPRSANKITGDASYTLYSVTLFRKYAADFALKARERRWIPRELEYAVGDADTASREEAKASESRSKERRLRNEVEKLAAATFTDIIKSWGHVKIIRVFVESVLRYGLPPNYVTAAFVPAHSYDKAEAVLIKEFGFLGGNAVTRDSKGRVIMDSDLGEYTALGENDYKPFVIYASQLP